MIICHVTSVHSSSDIRIFEKECTSLAKQTNNTVYLVAKGDSYKKNNVNVIGIGLAPLSRLKRIVLFSHQIIRKALQVDADVYHLHDPELLLYVGMLKRKNKIVIFDSHEDVADSILDKDYLHPSLRILLSKIYKIFSNEQMKKCDALVTVTPHIVKKLERSNKNVIMITNYPIIDDFKETIDSKKKNSIIFAGGVSKQWSHETVINALEKLDGFSYELYGPADEQYLEQLQSLDGWKQTNYYGKVDFNTVINAQKQARYSVVLLQPSNNTDFMNGTIGNTKLFESLSVGNPIICTNFSLWKQIIDKWQCGICVNPNNPDDVVNAIHFLCDNPDVERQMRENGLKAVNIEYNWNTQEKKLYELYNSFSNHRSSI